MCIWRWREGRGDGNSQNMWQKQRPSQVHPACRWCSGKLSLINSVLCPNSSGFLALSWIVVQSVVRVCVCVCVCVLCSTRFVRTMLNQWSVHQPQLDPGHPSQVGLGHPSGEGVLWPIASEVAGTERSEAHRIPPQEWRHRTHRLSDSTAGRQRRPDITVSAVRRCGWGTPRFQNREVGGFT